MEGLQNRLDSFLKAKRVKNPNKASYINVKWPHPPTYSATPEALADAGFYFNPTYEDRDTVTCYVCEKNLGGWEEEDDPLDLHWSKCGTVCCWAMVRCGLRSDMGSDGSYIFPDKDRLPTSTTMERARLETFSVGKGWIHDKPKNHGANSLKMARSGFAFTPQEPDDDLATCLYCGVCLSGWDPEDDPLEEHRKRDQKSKLNCPFFSFTESPAPSKPASKPKASKSRQSSRQRTTSSQHQDIVAPLKDDTDNESVASTSKKGARGRSTSKKLNRSQSRTTLGDVAEEEARAEEEEEEEKKPKKKAGKGKKSLAATTKGRGRAKATVQSEDDDIEIQEASPIEPVASQTQDAEPGKEDEAKSLKKSTRGRKPTRAASVEVPAATSQKPTRGKKKQPTPAAEPEPEPTQDTAGEDEEPPKRVRGKTPAKTPKTARKPSKSKAKPIAAPPEEPEIEEEEDDDLAAEAAAVEAIVLPSEPITRRQSSSSTRQSTVPPSRGSKPTSKGEAKFTQSSHSLPAGEDEREPEAAAPNDVAVEPPVPLKAKPADEDAEMDELPPLYVPKRGGKAKAAATDLGSSTSEQSTKPRLPSDRTVQMPAVAAVGAKNVPEDPKPIKIIKSASLRSAGSAAASEVSDSDTSDARKPLAKRLSKAPARKPSAAKQRPIKQESVVEISSDDDSDKEKKAKSNSEDVKGHKPSSSAEKPQQHPDAMVVDSIPANSQDTVEIDMKSPPAPSPKGRKSRSQSPLLSVQPAPSLPIRTATPSQSIPARSPSPVRPSPPEINDPLPVASTKEVVPVGQPDPHGQDINMTSPLAPKEQPAFIEPPRTPPRQTPFTTNAVQPKTADADPLFYPPLSRLPFTRIASLTDAELDMTVEDWIRYQMELEYDKFRRDGEKELARFKKAAEDVRKIIEGL